jgi:anti-anti-sigma factor
MITTTGASEKSAEYRIAFVKLPAAVDCTNIRMVMDSLTSALAGHPSVLIVDGAGMEYCDCGGISALVCAERRAATIGTRLRVVVTSQLVQRVIELTAADEMLDVYPTMDAALADLSGLDAAASPGPPPLTEETEEPNGRHRQPDC